MRPSHIRNALIGTAERLESSATPSREAVCRDIRHILAMTEQEGVLGVPVGQMLAHFQKWLSAKYAIDVAYRSFADRVKGPWRDALVDHWHEHAKEERGHAYDLAMRIVAMGGDPAQTTVVVPACASNLQGFFKTLSDMELEAIEAGRTAIGMAGDNTAVKVMAENFVVIDSHHLDDLRRMQTRFPET